MSAYRHIGRFLSMAGNNVVLLACLRCGAVVCEDDRHAHDLTHESILDVDSNTHDV